MQVFDDTQTFHPSQSGGAGPNAASPTFQPNQAGGAPGVPPGGLPQGWNSQPPQRRMSTGGWVAIVVAFLAAIVAIVIAFLAFSSKSTQTQAVPASSAPAPAQSASPAPQSSGAAQSSSSSSSSSSSAPATSAPAEEVGTVPTSSGDVVIENATVDANGTVTVYGYAVETGLTPEDVEALITYADEVIATIPTTTNGQNFNMSWTPQNLGSYGNIRDLATRGGLSELGKYQIQVKDRRHASSPGTVGFKPRTPGQISGPGVDRPGADSPSLPGGSAPSRPSGGRR